jgi:hypothetical protein
MLFLALGGATSVVSTSEKDVVHLKVSKIDALNVTFATDEKTLLGRRIGKIIEVPLSASRVY